MKITDVKSLQILDSRGNPTVRTFVVLEDSTTHCSSVPSGASTGSHEAVELRDNDQTHYNGKGVTKAVENVNTIIKTALVGMEADPNLVDDKLLSLDGTDDKSSLGANAMLSVSLAACRAASHAEKQPLWKFLHQYFFQSQSANHQSPYFPQLMVNIVNGGKHANWNFDIQEFMVVPNATKPSESIRIAAEIFHSLGNLLKQKGLSTLVGDEGGYSPKLSSNEEVFEVVVDAAKNAGYENVRDYRLSLDVAATEFYSEENYTLNSKKLNSLDLLSYYQLLTTNYQLLSIEDPFAEDDWEAWKQITLHSGGWPEAGDPHRAHASETSTSDGDAKGQDPLVIIGDDLLVTNPERIKRGISEKAANAVLIKVNQIGTIKETVEAINMTHDAGWKTAISHRSGETEDSFIADLAYACASEFIKTGSMSRSERLSKYNRLLEIEDGL